MAKRPDLENAIHTESKTHRTLVVVSALCVILISFIYCALYWTLLSRAIEFNDRIKALLPSSADTVEPYDRCLTKEGDIDSLDTQWTLAYTYNTVLYFSLSVLSCLLIFGSCSKSIRCAALVGHCLGCFAHLAGIILTGVVRFSEAGKACAEKQDFYNSRDDSFEEDADQMQAIFVT